MSSDDCNKEFDNKFDAIGKDLQWLPWVGNAFIHNKLLIVGESQYCDNTWNVCDRNATRTLIKNQGLNPGLNPAFDASRFHRNLEKTIFRKEKVSLDERKRLWTSVAFFNLVQCVLPSIKARPTPANFDDGWRIFFQIVNILKPECVLKCGEMVAGRLGNLLTNNKPGWKYDDKEYYSRPRLMHLSQDSYQFKILFINHPSGSWGYKPENWGKFIEQQLPEFAKSLGQPSVIATS